MTQKATAQNKAKMTQKATAQNKAKMQTKGEKTFSAHHNSCIPLRTYIGD